MSRSQRIIFNIVRFVLGAGLVYWILRRTEGFEAAKPMLKLPWLAAALVALGFAGVGVEAVRLRLLLKSQGVHLAFFLAYRIIMIGTFFNVVIPGGTGGDVMKLYYLARANRGRGIEVAMILLVDRVVALSSMLILLTAFALIEGNLLRDYAAIRWMTLGAAGLSAALIVGIAISMIEAVRQNRLFNRLVDMLPLKAFLHRAIDAVHDFKDHKGALVFGILISMVGHGALAMMFMFMGKEIYPTTPSLVICLLSFLGILANVVPVTPGGLGVGEAAFNGLFKMCGLTGGAVIMVVWRIASLPLVILGGFHYMFGLKEMKASAPVFDVNAAVEAAGIATAGTSEDAR